MRRPYPLAHPFRAVTAVSLLVLGPALPPTVPATASTAVVAAPRTETALPRAAAVTALVVSAARAATPDTGYVRLAHLSPDTPAVDVYLAPAGADQQSQIFPGVGYGTVSAYLPLPTGRYVVAMRAAGAPPTQPPVLTTDVVVSPGAAYTIAGVGRYADLGLRVLDDDLTPPADGQAKIRIVHASLRIPVLDIATGEGAPVARGVQFATTTAYQQVTPGSRELTLRSDARREVARVRLDADTVYSLLLLDYPGGRLDTRLRIDARNGDAVAASVSPSVPAAAATSARTDTATGSSPPVDRGRPPYVLVLAAAATLGASAALAGLLTLRRRHRSTP